MSWKKKKGINCYNIGFISSITHLAYYHCWLKWDSREGLQPGIMASSHWTLFSFKEGLSQRSYTLSEQWKTT